MSITDKQIGWLRKRVFVDALGFSLVEATATLQSAADSTVVPVEVGAVGIAGLNMSADNDQVQLLWPIPYDFDPKFEVGFRVWWTGETVTSGGDALFTIQADVKKKGIAIAAATTALNTPIVSCEYLDSAGAATTTDDLLQITSRGIKNPLGISRDDIEKGAALSIDLIKTSDTTITTIIMLGLEIDYAPQRCTGIGNEIIPFLEADRTS